LITRTQVFSRAAIAALISCGLLFYLLLNTAPYQINAELNRPIVALFLFGLFVLAASIGSAIMLPMHSRWPGLAGTTEYDPNPLVAVRQGILFGSAIVIIALLALTQLLDIVFIAFALLVAGLIEAFLQSRSQ